MTDHSTRRIVTVDDELFKLPKRILDSLDLPESGVRWAGSWDGQSAYLVGDVVAYQGSAYIANVDGLVNVVPPANLGPDRWTVLAQGGEQGPVGPTAGTEYQRVTPAAEWSLIHNLNRRPLVTIFDQTGEEVEADVVATSTTVVITFPSPTAGSVVLT